MPESSKHNRIADWMESERALNRYVRVTRGFEHLIKLVRSRLPEPIAEQVQIRYYREGELALNVPSGAVATRIKMLSPSLIVDLAGERTFRNLIRISVKVRPVAVKEERKHEPLYALSEENCRLLESVAGETKDEGLKQSLLRLAKKLPASE